MTNDSKTLLNDEVLHFLYSNASFQGLLEEEQQHFLERFQNHDGFKEMIEISMALEETITEVEATMPKMQDKDFLFAQQAQREVLKERTIVDGNVYYIPFDQLDKIYSPMIIALQQSNTMKEFDTFCKGTILPLFNLCAHQKRDLIILPFGTSYKAPLCFHNGIMDVNTFDAFLNGENSGEAAIIPVLTKALKLFEEDPINNQRDLMIITDNQFTDFNELIQNDVTYLLRALHIDVSVIAMSEVDFEVQPITFADKVFFANE